MMSEKKIKWYTCTPVAFKGDHTFFCRDTGIICKGFQALGIESRAIMPLPAQEGDYEDVLRTEYANLESATWWAGLEIEGVVFYTWGAPRYNKIVKAARQAGLKIVVCMDTSGNFFPFIEWMSGVKGIIRAQQFEEPFFVRRWWNIFLYCAYHHTLGLLMVQWRRWQHWGCADVVGFCTKQGVLNLKRFRWLLGDNVFNKIALLGSPVASYFCYDPKQKKEDSVIVVGRWDDERYKRTSMLLSVLENFVSRNSSFVCNVVGHTPESVYQWHAQLSEGLKSRIVLYGRMSNIDIVKEYQKSKISLCTSYSEGCHVASIEALCCGCSVVGVDKPALNCLQWYVEHDSGTLAQEDTVESFVDAIEQECRAWDEGQRNPVKIADLRQSIHHNVAVAQRILNLVEGGVSKEYYPQENERIPNNWDKNSEK